MLRRKNGERENGLDGDEADDGDEDSPLTVASQPLPKPPTAFQAAGADFTVQLPAFHGSLAELASALRTGRVLPAEVPLLQLTREVLSWVQDMTEGAGSLGGTAISSDPTTPSNPTIPSDPWASGQSSSAVNVGRFAQLHPDMLPTLASVIALKARLLLPKPAPATLETETLETPLDAPEELLDDVQDTVDALLELDALVQFLAERRRGREGLIPAKPLNLDLPRRERKRNPQGSLAKLLKAAQHAVRQVEVPLLARERLTLADALKALKAFGVRLKQFTFRGVPTQDWGERTTYFAALLEGVKDGTFDVQQAEIYGEIAVTFTPAEQRTM